MGLARRPQCGRSIYNSNRRNVHLINSVSNSGQAGRPGVSSSIVVADNSGESSSLSQCIEDQLPVSAPGNIKCAGPGDNEIQRRDGTAFGRFR